MTQQMITPAVSPRMLAQVSRLFSNRGAPFQEILQNSLRAGATHIAVTHAGDTLTFQDDGRGQRDAQVLLTIADSGWGDDVIEPAGLGLLSTLNPEYVSAIEVTSHFGTFRITPQEFAAGTAVPVDETAALPGFRVVLHLSQPMDVGKLLTANRGYARTNVTLNGSPVVRRPLGDPHACPAGTMYLSVHTHAMRYDGQRHTGLQGLWENFPVSVKILSDAVKQHTDAIGGSVLSTTEVILDIDPASGLRPKLPDRQDLIDNAAVEEAAVSVAQVIQAEGERRLREALTDLGQDELSEDTVKAARDASNKWAVNLFLSQQGYVRESRVNDLSETNYTLYDKESHTQNFTRVIWVRATPDDLNNDDGNDLGYGRQRTQSLLRQLGIGLPRMVTLGTGYVGPALALDYEVETIVSGPVLYAHPLGEGGHDFLFGFAPGVTLGGVSVPFLTGVTTQNAASEDVDVRLLLAGTPDEIDGTVRAHQNDLGGLLLLDLGDMNELNDHPLLTDNDEGDSSLFASELAGHLETAMLEQLFPQRATAATRVADLKAQNAHLSSAHYELRQLDGEKYTAIIESLTADMTANKADIDALTAEHRL